MAAGLGTYAWESERSGLDEYRAIFDAIVSRDGSAA